ncbi:MAG: ABC transporter permease [Chloroflexota bacterium]
MSWSWEGILRALTMLSSGDSTLIEITLLSLRVTGAALFIATLIGIPIGAFIGLRSFPGKRAAVALIYTGFGLPPVIAGLFTYVLLSRGSSVPTFIQNILPSLFTPGAMIFAQVIISTPIIAGFTMTAVLSIDRQLALQLRSLGATPAQTAVTILSEARNGVIAAVIAGFGSIISEVGAVMMVGGNIAHRTRVLTSAIVLETSKGNFELAMALGFILISITFLASALVILLQGRSRTA